VSRATIVIFEDIPRINCPSSQLTQKCLTLDLRRLMMTEPFLSMPYLGSLASCLSTRPADVHHYLVLSRRRSVIREHIDHSGILSDTEAWERYDIRDCMASSSERMSSFFEVRYFESPPQYFDCSASRRNTPTHVSLLPDGSTRRPTFTRISHYPNRPRESTGVSPAIPGAAVP